MALLMDFVAKICGECLEDFDSLQVFGDYEMRKTQVALAALALVASSAAMAEGVTIYGTLEGGLANTTDRGSYFSGAGGFNGGTWIGFKGQEDINGTKAFFNLEAGIDLNGYSNNGGAGANNPTGTSVNSPIFSRQANIGLASDSLGTLTIGQQLSPFVASVAGTGTLGVGHFFVNRLLMGGGGAPAALTTASNVSFEGFFIPNSYSYATPSLGGFTATVLSSTPTGNGRGTIPAAGAADRYSSASLTGAVANVNVSLAYQVLADTYKTWAVSANTNVGGITIAGNYMSNKFEADASSVNSWNIGAGYDVAPALNVSLQYARTGGEASATNNLLATPAASRLDSQSLYGLAAKYSLSKRTSLYASFTRATNGAQSAYDTRGSYTNTGADNRTTAVGVLHSF